jgi:hypothetical protein
MAFADTVKFTAGSSGTSDFSDGTALTGFRSLSTGAVSGQTYSYRAFSADLSQWENGQGVYTSGSPGTLARTTIYESSTGSKINFTTAPVVILTPLKSDLDAAVAVFTGDSGSGGVKGQVPAPASGDAAAGKFLKADGSWAAVITPWVAYTPTFTGMGTVTNISFFSRRVGDTLEIEGNWTLGTGTATEARVTLGFNGTNNNVTTDSTKVPSIRQAGIIARSDSSGNPIVSLMESSVGYFTIGIGSSGWLTKQNGSSLSVSGTTYSVRASFPISGW